MKKPNITPGEWEIQGPQTETVKIPVWGDNHVAAAYAGNETNAQAISAVPRLIESGCWAFNMLTSLSQELKDKIVEEQGGTVWYELQKLEQALKKAGCTENQESHEDNTK